MVVVYVKNYLNNEGITFFSEWFKNIASILKKQDGFLSIGYWQDKQDISCMSLLLKFENEEKLTAWGRSNLHDVEVGKLDVYRTKPYNATRINFINYVSKDGF